MLVFLVASSSPALSVVRSPLSVAHIVQAVQIVEVVKVVEIVEFVNLAHSDNSPV